MLRKSVFILFLYTLSSASFAQKLLTCASSGGAWTKCKLTEELGLAKKKNFSWAPEECSQDYVFSYTFPCAGNLHGLVFSAGLAAKALLFTSGDASHLEFVSGPNDLRIIDSNKKLTRSATVFGTCTLNISSTHSFPSSKCIDQVTDAIVHDADALLNILNHLKTIEASLSNDNSLKFNMSPLIERLEEYSEISPNSLFTNLLQQELGTLKEMGKECEQDSNDRSTLLIKSLVLECENQIKKYKSILESMKLDLIDYIKILENIKSEKVEDLLRTLKRIQTQLI